MSTAEHGHLDRVERRAAVAALIVGFVLLAAKFVAYALTSSAAVFADATESIVNVCAGGFALWALAYARRPADPKHPYGHGKIEFISALLEGGMILVAAVVIAARAVELAWRGAEPTRPEWGLLIVAAAGAANGLLGQYLIRVGRRTGSLALEADGRHLLTDAVTSAGLVLALALVAFTGWAWIDPLAALGLAIYLGIEGARLVGRAAGGLMDRQDDADHALLQSLLEAHLGPDGHSPQVCSFHALRHRHVGRDHWVDFHLVVPANWDVARGHEVATALEMELQAGLGGPDPDQPGLARATAHVEPCRDRECDFCEGVR